jgi:hypothetical protein
MTPGKNDIERARAADEFLDWINGLSLRERSEAVRTICEEAPIFAAGLLRELRLDPQAETRAVEYIKQVRAQAIDPTVTRAQRADAEWWLREHGYDNASLLREDDHIADTFPAEG